MALVAGTVDVDADGVATGSGLALDLYDAERATHPPAFTETPPSATVLEVLQTLATKCEAHAAAFVASVEGADIRVAEDALDTGVPTVERLLTGAIE